MTPECLGPFQLRYVTYLLVVFLALSACAEQSTTANAATGAPGEDSLELTGAELYELHCAGCHADGAKTKAPTLTAMQQTSMAGVLFALTNGKMKEQAAALDLSEQLRLAEFAGVRRDGYEAPAEARCDDTSIDLNPRISRWGIDSASTRFIGPGVSGIDSDNVGTLRLKWAFGLPSTADARAQPVVTDDTLFIAATSGFIFALDRRAGCIKWQYQAPAPLRTALTLGHIDGLDARRAVLVFGDADAHASSIDASTGELIWRTDVGVGEHSILTGAIVQTGSRLIVPVSLYEVALARNPTYECCKTHGAVASLDVSSGAILWTTHLTDAAVVRGETTFNVPRWGPSGVPVWSTPTVDAERGVAYVGTGQNASAPATQYSDSVLALDLETGVIVWHFQAMAGDVYNDGCASVPAGPNCPSFPGPDFDIGASVVMATQSDGREVLLVGQKSGDVYALDPDARGELIWRERVGSGSALGGVHWGLAVRDDTVFVPASDPEFPIPGYFPKPGITALAIDDGEVEWTHAADRGCETSLGKYMQRADLYPECRFYYGFSAAPTVVNDVLLAASTSGVLEARVADTGELVWSYDTVRPYDTVNGIDAHGGSIDVAGPVAVGDMLYVQSGYSLFGQLPGNVLLAFEVQSDGP